MNKEDYEKYYIQKADHYLVPADIFIELIDEMINWREDCKNEIKEKEELKQALIDIREYCNNKRNLFQAEDYTLQGFTEYVDEDDILQTIDKVLGGIK